MAKKDAIDGDDSSNSSTDGLGPYGDEAVELEKASEEADVELAEDDDLDDEDAEDEDDLEDDDEDDYEFADTDGDGIPDKFEVGEDDPSPQTTLFWTEAHFHPVEVALPNEVGLTLRHYRVTGEGEDETEEAVFLAHKGKLHLFRSPAGLIEFINSDAPHDLTEIEGWEDVRSTCSAADIVADEDDRYELDLVVENLRGGHDVWEADVLVPAGELARDVAFACELTDVLKALASGTPLDDLDEALRDGGFLARRRMKKMGAEQAAIAWRSVIGKISAAVTWHD